MLVTYYKREFCFPESSPLAYTVRKYDVSRMVYDDSVNPSIQCTYTGEKQFPSYTDFFKLQGKNGGVYLTHYYIYINMYDKLSFNGKVYKFNTFIDMKNCIVDFNMRNV